MDARTHALFESRARIIKALAHPTRLFIVDALSRQEHCVCELTEMIGADTSTVSKHLAILYNVGIIDNEKRGTMVYYSLKTPCVLNFIQCTESVMKTGLQERIELMR